MSDSLMKRWGIFFWERFSPINYTIMIFSFLLGNGMLAVLLANTSPSLPQIILASATVFLIFFHLRLFDERKDYETDLKIHPERPLARGIVRIEEVKILGWAIILLELLLSALISWQSLLSIIMVVGFSLIMLKEFFIGAWLRPQMELYAITHTFVSVFMSLFVFSAFSSFFVWQIPLPGLIFALNAWLIFTIFEFARKTYASMEEKEKVDSYSKRLGKFGAVFVVFGMALTSFIVAIYIGKMVNISYLYYYITFLVIVLLAMTGLAYTLSAKSFFAKLYRQTVNLYMLLFYLALGLVLLFQDRML